MDDTTNPKNPTRGGSASQSAGLFSVDDSRDYPWGSGENDNYINVCVSCDHRYRGHKRSQVCRRCHEKSRAWWNSMTPEQQDSVMAERGEMLRKVLSENVKEQATPAKNGGQPECQNRVES